MYPILFTLFGFQLKTYGLMVTLAFASGIILAYKRAQNRNLNPDEIMNMSTIIIISAIIGSRILYVLVNPQQYINDPITVLYIHKGGLVFLGGLLAVIPVISWYLTHYKMNYLLWADVMFPSVALGQIFGRFGCFFNGCCYGHETTSSFGIIFPAIGDGIRHLPTQLFESAACLVILILLLFIDKKKSKNGYVFASYIFLYSLWRFFIEFFRGDNRGTWIFNLPVSQFISIFGIIIGIIFLLYLKYGKTEIDKNGKVA